MGLSRVIFDISTPCNGDELGAHIAHARSLGLPPSDAEPIKTLTIVANGPSRILHDPHAPGDTLALNGALKHFTDAGTWPTFWAACDPQALVADFIPDNPPKETIYLVASKCHPSVFQKLQGRTVRIWDINDHPDTRDAPRAVPVASSVTLVAQTHMRDAYGYRHFEIYGWDACYQGLEHHAGQFHDKLPEETTVQLCVGATARKIKRGKRKGETVYEGGRWFTTSRTWAAEAQDALTLTHHATWTLNVHGDGLIRAMLQAARDA